jgi:hypothetical protein
VFIRGQSLNAQKSIATSYCLVFGRDAAKPEMTDRDLPPRALRKALMMLASVSIEDGPTHPVRVRNLSVTGMSGVSDQPLPLGTHIKVELTELISGTGRIVRTEGRSIGVAFDTPLDLSSLNITPKSASVFEVSSLHKVSETVRRPRIKP